MAKCRGTRTNGAPCHAWALAGSDFCFRHDPDPDTARQRAAASLRGGQASHRERAAFAADEPDAPLKNLSDVAPLLEQCINRALKGNLDVRICNAVSLLSSILLKALKEGDFEKRLSQVEKAVGIDTPQRTGP